MEGGLVRFYSLFLCWRIVSDRLGLGYDGFYADATFQGRG